MTGQLDGSFLNDSDHLDQHFLIDQNIIDLFIKYCNLSKKDDVVEIGPGKGTLTQIIAPKVKSLTAIELDERLKPYLGNIPNLKVMYCNVLDIEIPKCNKIITALPYSIIEPFIYKLTKTDFEELYMIMGSTYVDNVLNNEINNLSLLTNTFFDTKKLFKILPESFNPEPKTLSYAVKITPKNDFKGLNLIFKYLYELDNKKIKNSLMEALIALKSLTKKEAKGIINNLNINNEILDKCFNQISNKELKELYQNIKSIDIE